MVNQYWQKPYDNQDAPLTVKDWNQSLSPMINAEFSQQQSSVQARMNDIERKYVARFEYDTLRSQYHILEARFNEVMEILALKGNLTEDDLKEFRDSRKLANKIAEEVNTAKMSTGL